MKPFLTEEAAKKLAPCESSQRNECVNSLIGTKHRKFVTTVDLRVAISARRQQFRNSMKGMDMLTRQRN